MITAPERQVAIADEPAVLGAVTRPEVVLALWRRRLAPVLRDWLCTLPPDALPAGRLTVRPGEAGAALRDLLAPDADPAGPGAAAFLADAAELARHFAALAGARLVDLRLEAIDHDACWKFHRDSVSLRLLCSYRGPGTQYVPAGRAASALSLQRGYRGPLHEVPSEAVALFRGSQAPHGQGVVHRSPPIAGRGVTRLLLCLGMPGPASPRPRRP